MTGGGAKATTPVWFLAAALAIAASFSAVPAFFAADKSAEALVLFREGGDPDYLPQVSALAALKFGETSVREYAGTGVRAFPLAPFAIHAIFYRAAGSVGFLLADILMVVFYAVLLRRFLTLGGVASGPAGILSLAVVSGAMRWFLDKIGTLAHHDVPVMLWEFRFPRPSVTQAFFVLFLLAATLAAVRPARSVRLYVGLGASFALILQSDIYAAFDAALVFGAVCVYALVAVSPRPDARKDALKRVGAAIAAAVIASLPFLYQQLHTSPDLKRRWGAFFTPSYLSLLPDRYVVLCCVLFLASALAAAAWFRRDPALRNRIAPLTIAGAALAASLISGPFFLALLRQTIQTYHFQDQTELMLGYMLLLGTGWVLTDLKLMRYRIPAIAAATLAVAFFCFSAWRSSYARAVAPLPTAPSMGPFALTHYRPDFAELHALLSSPAYADAQVLGTLDVQLSNWWQYRNRYVYLADLFNTTVADAVVERRADEFLKLAGTSPQEYGALLDNWYFLIRFIGCYKYQANSRFTPWPLTAYSDAAQRRIAATSWPHSIELPEPERARLLRDYADTETTGPAPDLLVLDKDPLRSCLHPERGGRWRLAWSNRTFEVWTPVRLRAEKF